MAADSAESAGIHYRQFCINLPPVADHIRPLFGQIMRGKIECFEQSSAVRKNTSATVQAAVPAVQTFNGVCCVDHPSDGLGELEHGTDDIPIRLPTSHGSRIFFVPFLTDSQHIPMCGLLIRSVVDGLQIVCKVLSVLIRDIFQRIPDHMDNALLILCHRKGSGDCFTDTAQTVCAEHENVSDTSVFQFIQHTQPEFCTLIVSNRNAQYLFMSFLTDPEDHISSVLADDAFAPDIEDDCVYVHDGIHGAQRAFLPLLDLRQDLVRYGLRMSPWLH